MLEIWGVGDGDTRFGDQQLQIVINNISSIYLILAELEANWSKFNFQSKTTVFDLFKF